MKIDQYLDSTEQLHQHMKAGLIRALCLGGLLTPTQRDELLRRQRVAQN